MAGQESNKRVRISLDLTPSFYERLEALEKLTESESKAAVIRQALQVYEFISRRTLEGCSFRAVRPDGTAENLVFFSPYVAVTEELVTTR